MGTFYKELGKKGPMGTLAPLGALPTPRPACLPAGKNLICEMRNTLLIWFNCLKSLYHIWVHTQRNSIY